VAQHPVASPPRIFSTMLLRMRKFLHSKAGRFFVVFLAASGLSALLVVLAVKFASREPKIGGDFTLVHRGNPWNFISNAKELNLFYVGYVKCPDVCPLTLSYAAQAMRGLTEEERARVQLVFLSVDAEHDTAAEVADYASQFSSNFVGLTGSREAIDEVVKQFRSGYTVEKDPKSHLGYSISHPDRVYLLSRNGAVIDHVSSPRASQPILEKIKEHL
jgi:protein SCO1/2